MADPYLTPAEQAAIKADLERIFPSVKGLGYTVDLTLYRDSEQDGTPVPVLPNGQPQNVRVVFAKREAAVQSGPASVIVGADGELRKEPPFDVQLNDRFTLPDGLSGRVSAPPLPGLGYVRAPFLVGA